MTRGGSGAVAMVTTSTVMKRS